MTPHQHLNILLADDGSEHARAAVSFLQDISLPPNSRILVFRAFSSGQIPWVPEFERSLELTKDQLSNRGYLVETELQLGSASEKILEIAEEQKPDMIVLGAKGLRSTVNILLGGVAQQVMEYSCCPVLIVRAPYHGFLRILLVTDGSASSRSAAAYLTRFPRPANAAVHVMHVLHPIWVPAVAELSVGGWQTVYVPGMEPDEETARQEEESKHGEALLTETCSLLQAQGIEASMVLARGDAATEIINYVRKNQVDLIVAGSRGLGNFKSMWVGSVSRKLVHYSDCSVLVVKEPKKE